MAELGAIASIIGLASVALAAARKTHQYVEGIQDAPAEVADLSDDLSSLMAILEDLRKFLEDNRNIDASRTAYLNALSRPLTSCMNESEEIMETIKPYVKAFDGDKPFVWSAKWSFYKKDDVMEHHKTLTHYKETLHLTVSVVNLSFTNENLNDLRAHLLELRQELGQKDVSRNDLTAPESASTHAAHDQVMQDLLTYTETVIGNPSQDFSVSGAPAPNFPPLPKVPQQRSDSVAGETGTNLQVPPRVPTTPNIVQLESETTRIPSQQVPSQDIPMRPSLHATPSAQQNQYASKTARAPSTARGRYVPDPERSPSSSRAQQQYMPHPDRAPSPTPLQPQNQYQPQYAARVPSPASPQPKYQYQPQYAARAPSPAPPQPQHQYQPQYAARAPSPAPNSAQYRQPLAPASLPLPVSDRLVVALWRYDAPASHLLPILPGDLLNIKSQTTSASGETWYFGHRLPTYTSSSPHPGRDGYFPATHVAPAIHFYDRAAHDFFTTDKECLGFMKGEKVTVMFATPSVWDWWVGSTKDGKRGRFPAVLLRGRPTAVRGSRVEGRSPSVAGRKQEKRKKKKRKEEEEEESEESGGSESEGSGGGEPELGNFLRVPTNKPKRASSVGSAQRWLKTGSSFLGELDF